VVTIQLFLVWTLFLPAFGTGMPPASAAILHEQSEREQILDEGRKHMSEGRFPEAIAAFGRLKRMAPWDSQAYFFSGIAFAESGHLSAAAAELSEAVRLGPEHPEHALALANVLVRLGQKWQAMSALSVFDDSAGVIRLSSANLLELMKVYFSLDRTTEALRLTDELAARDRNYPRIDFYRAKIYRIAGNLDLAQQAIQESLKKAPDNPADLLELGKIYEQRGQAAAAKSALLDALKHGPSEPEALYSLASVCLSLDEADEAIEYLTRAEPAAASLPKIYYALGQAFQKKGDSVKAAQYLRQQRAQESNLSRLQKESREREEAFLISLAREQREQGKRAGEQALLQQLLELNSNSWEAHQRLAEIFLSSGEWTQARSHLDQLEKIDPLAFEGNRLMAEYCYRREDYTRALQYAERAKSVRPGSADLRNLLGNIHLKSGRLSAALEEYALAVRYAPERAEFRENLQAAQKLERK